MSRAVVSTKDMRLDTTETVFMCHNFGRHLSARWELGVVAWPTWSVWNVPTVGDVPRAGVQRAR